MVYTGDGKGKTTAAMGLVLRAVGHGHRVAVLQFMKGQPTGELQAITDHLPGVETYRYGTDAFVNPDDPDPEDLRLAQQGEAKAIELLERPDIDLLILDEANVAMSYGLIDGHKLSRGVEARPPSMTVVLTGRGLDDAINRIADLISEVKEIRHHWRKGIPAQDGIEQ
jgi:cob(I)alamin adenosyltransferase